MKVTFKWFIFAKHLDMTDSQKLIFAKMHLFRPCENKHSQKLIIQGIYLQQVLRIILDLINSDF